MSGTAIRVAGWISMLCIVSIQFVEALNYDTMAVREHIPFSHHDAFCEGSGFQISNPYGQNNIILYSYWGPYIKIFNPVNNTVVSEYTVQGRPCIYSMVSTDIDQHVVSPVPKTDDDDIKFHLLNAAYQIVNTFRGDKKKRVYDLVYLSENRFMVYEGTSWHEIAANKEPFKAYITIMSVVNQEFVTESEVELDLGSVRYPDGSLRPPNKIIISADREIVYFKSTSRLYRVELKTKQHTVCDISSIESFQEPYKYYSGVSLSTVARIENSILVGGTYGYIYRFNEACEYQQALPNVAGDKLDRNPIEDMTARNGKLYVTMYEDGVFIFQ